MGYSSYSKSKLFPLFNLFLLFHLLGFDCNYASPVDVISACLSFHGVQNFTTLPRGENDSTSDYYRLLKFSIQNLRFAEPRVPKPTAIILPGSLEELASAVSCSTEGSFEIRVRSGGHSYEGTSSVAIDGASFVIIDMMNLNRVWNVDLNAETAWVEGGATLGEVYYEISKVSKTHGFSAGSCPTVGVGGHIGGGGFGLLSRKYGLAADNVVDALVFDCEGKLLNRERMGEDLFWAIRGGGGGVWGVVYAWKIHLVPLPQTVTAFVVSRGAGNKSRVAELVDKWQHVAPTLEPEFYLSCFVGAALPEAVETPRMTATFKGLYLGPRRNALSIATDAFSELEISERDCVEMSWIESVVFFSGLRIGSSISELKNRFLKDKNYFKAKSDYVRTPIPADGIKAAIETLEKEPKGYVILDPYGGKMETISSDAIAFPHRKGNLFAIQYLVEWHHVNKDKQSDYLDWIRELHHKMTPFVSSSPRAAYINYMDFDLGVMQGTDQIHGGPTADAAAVARAWGEKYFLDNYDRLVRVKTDVDPNNVFNNPQGIPPNPINLAKSFTGK